MSSGALDPGCARSAASPPPAAGRSRSPDPLSPARRATPRRASTCLSQNDFQGLLYTYPVCDSLSIRQSAEPLCVVSQRNIGWVRFVAATLPPFVFASVAVFLLVYVALNLENKDQTRNRWKLAGNSARETAYTNRRDSRRAAAAPGRAEERA